jgi:AcrR family transcriptional regulator
MNKGKRAYQKRRRAESEAATRRRITEAAVELHATVGPAQTTVAEIARRAGVQRLTVYLHFPDQRALFQACTTHWFGLNPLPAIGAWQETGAFEQRLRSALLEVYAYYRTHEQLISNWLRDAQLIPVLQEFAETGYYGYLEQLQAALLPAAGGDQQDVRAMLLLALHFETWRLLTQRGGLSDNQAASDMTEAIVRKRALPSSETKRRPLEPPSDERTRRMISRARQARESSR